MGAAHAQTSPHTPDIGSGYTTPIGDYDYTVRVEEIPMRDGVTLHTVIVIPKGAKNAPIVLTRTPYSADVRSKRMDSTRMRDRLRQGDEIFVDAGYIRVTQDVRGKYGSKGEYIMNRPLVGPLNNTKVDHSTDAYDSIDWLVKNLKESNGRVGIIGSSYPGFTTAMALVNPHPALKVASPQSPMINNWMGDDWFHYGAFRPMKYLDFFVRQTAQRGSGSAFIPRDGYDDYTNFLRAGSTGDYARAHGLQQLPFWRKIVENAAYTKFWEDQALDGILAKQPLKVPTMWLQGLFDQEDIWGAIHSYEAIEPQDTTNTMNYLVMGPWRHGQVDYDGTTLGELTWNGDTAGEFRRDVLLPFFNQYLVDGAPKANTPPVLIYNTGKNRWDRHDKWPLSCGQGCASTSKPLYLGANGTLSFNAPKASDPKFDAYVSDPAKPVPHQPRPISVTDREGWQTWLVRDQRFVDGRPDVLTFQTEPLSQAVRVGGVPVVNLMASTTGSDSDWVVKLIDVYPDTVASFPQMGGYQFPIALDIFRGRYRTSFSDPQAIVSNHPANYKFGLPTVNHVF
ncbi:MAG: CocE/NonD family hydrolase, partial [Rhodanobacter sp.]